MRRLTAILIILLFLFNVAGYRMLFHYLDNKSEKKYETIIEKQHYDESSLLTLKIDLNIPYQAERTEFERVSGEITVDGVVYQYVKRRIYNGQLVLLCIPNHEKTKLQEVKNNYVEWSYDLNSKEPSQTGSSKHSVQKNVFSDYEFVATAVLYNTAFTLDKNKVLTDEAVPHLQILDSPSQPPEWFI